MNRRVAQAPGGLTELHGHPACNRPVECTPARRQRDRHRIARTACSEVRQLLLQLLAWSWQKLRKVAWL